MDAFAGRYCGGSSGQDSGVELTLGLSLNGRFGVDPTKIPRSTTISAFPPPVGVDGGGSSSQLSAAAEADQHYRKLKEIQAINRLVARKRRFDKFISRQHGKGDEYSDETNSSHEPAVNGGGDAPPRSVRTKPGGSSAVKADDRGNEQSAQAAQAQVSSKNKPPKALRPLIPPPRAAEKKVEPKNVMAEMRMPYVTAVGNGPNGRRVEGILCSYARREVVTIMCVCHGYFMSPAQFIEHAGGQVVGNGFHQITVNLPHFVSIRNPTPAAMQ